MLYDIIPKMSQKAPNDTLVEYNASVVVESGDKFMFSQGKHMGEMTTKLRTRTITTRWWELLCYRGGLKSYHIRVTRGQIHFKVIRKYARVDPIIRFIDMLIRVNKPFIADILETIDCDADNCIYAANTYLVYCEYGNPEGMIIYRDGNGKRRRRLIKLNTTLIPSLANMATRQQTKMVKPEIKPRSMNNATAKVNGAATATATSRQHVCNHSNNHKCNHQSNQTTNQGINQGTRLPIKTQRTWTPEQVAGVRREVDELRIGVESGNIDVDLLRRLRDLAMTGQNCAPPRIL